uniref:Ceramide synthase 4 n=1 Tax=Macaca fascicularis TaxID=9541 RepID=A0A7N9D841_MACFA
MSGARASPAEEGTREGTGETANKGEARADGARSGQCWVQRGEIRRRLETRGWTRARRAAGQRWAERERGRGREWGRGQGLGRGLVAPKGTSAWGPRARSRPCPSKFPARARPRPSRAPAQRQAPPFWGARPPRPHPRGPAPASPHSSLFFPCWGRGPAGSRVRLPGAGFACLQLLRVPRQARRPQPRRRLSVRPAACAPRFIGLPLSQWLGVRDQTRRQVKPNATLEKHFLTEGHRPKEPQLSLLAARCGLTLRQTQRWFRRRRKQDRPQLTKKFCEASWRFLFYLSSFVGGLSVLYHESWLWAPVMCWENYPNQTLKPSLYWWYLLELAFYLSLLIRLPFDVKRKDFKEQVIHHFVVVILMTFSYSANLLRIGSLVLLLHDSADYLLEACKMVNYTQYQHVCDALFLIFSLVFFYTRLVLFPTQILYTTYYESLGNRGPFFGYYFCNGLLMLLQLLHVFWSCLILRMLCSFIKKGQMEKDIRSDVEESDSSEEEEAGAQEPLQLKNGAARGPRPAPTDGLRSRVAGRLTRHTTAT